MRPDRVVPIVLAAGGSTRMGRPKASLPFGGSTALGRILATCSAAGLAPAVVVSGAHPDAVAAAAAGAEPAPRIVHNADWATGRAGSIRAGLSALAADADGFALWPVDVCLPGAEIVTALVADASAHPDVLGWVPSFQERRGHPILFHVSVADSLRALAPDEPARAVTRALHADGKLRHLVVNDPTVRMEMNTPEEYARWLAHAKGWVASDEPLGD